MGRKANNTEARDFPLVNVQRIKFESLKCDVDSRYLEKLGQYITYVHEATGEKPTQGEVVGVALDELFKLDKGFGRWQEQAARSDGQAHKSGNEPTQKATA